MHGLYVSSQLLQVCEICSRAVDASEFTGFEQLGAIDHHQVLFIRRKLPLRIRRTARQRTGRPRTVRQVWTPGQRNLLLVVLHVTGQGRRRIVAPITDRTLERFLVVVRLHVDLQVIAAGEKQKELNVNTFYDLPPKPPYLLENAASQ